MSERNRSGGPLPVASLVAILAAALAAVASAFWAVRSDVSLVVGALVAVFSLVGLLPLVIVIYKVSSNRTQRRNRRLRRNHAPVANDRARADDPTDTAAFRWTAGIVIPVLAIVVLGGIQIYTTQGVEGNKTMGRRGAGMRGPGSVAAKTGSAETTRPPLAHELLLADLDADDDPECVVIQQLGTSLRLLVADGETPEALAFGEPSPETSGSPLSESLWTAAYVDNDELQDVVSLSRNGSGTPTVVAFLSTGSTFVPSPVALSDEVRSQIGDAALTLADVDQDGIDEFVGLARRGGTTRFVVMDHEGSSGLTVAERDLPEQLRSVEPSRARLTQGDFNKDRWPDLAVAFENDRKKPLIWLAYRTAQSWSFEHGWDWRGGYLDFSNFRPLGCYYDSDSYSDIIALAGDRHLQVWRGRRYPSGDLWFQEFTTKYPISPADTQPPGLLDLPVKYAKDTRLAVLSPSKEEKRRSPSLMMILFRSELAQRAGWYVATLSYPVDGVTRASLVTTVPDW